MSELMFSGENKSLSLQGLAELAAISSVVSCLCFLGAKILGKSLPKRNDMSPSEQAFLLFTIVFMCGFLGAVFGGQKKEATHSTELYGCLIGSAIGVVLDLISIRGFKKAQLKMIQDKERLTPYYGV